MPTDTPSVEQRERTAFLRGFLWGRGRRASYEDAERKALTEYRDAEADEIIKQMSERVDAVGGQP